MNKTKQENVQPRYWTLYDAFPTILKLLLSVHGVAWIWCEGTRNTLKYFNGVAQKYYETYATNGDIVTGTCAYAILLNLEPRPQRYRGERNKKLSYRRETARQLCMST